MNSVSPTLLRFGIAILVLLLFHPYRFSELQMNYETIAENDIIQSLEKNVVGSEKPACQIDMVELGQWSFNRSSQQRRLDVLPGGQWKPKNCSPTFDCEFYIHYNNIQSYLLKISTATIIVPYRDREDHLTKFLQWIHPFLQAQNLSYLLILVEQTKGDPFNRAKLFNVGAIESRKIKRSPAQCFIFHDIDLLPLNAKNLYACSSTPMHLSAYVDTMRYNLPYSTLFGGAVSVPEKIFQAVNGFSNGFRGWGGEDDDFWLNRLSPYLNKKLARYEYPISKYTMLHHKQAEPSNDRFEQLQKGRLNVEEDGLNSIEYKVISHVQRDLYTHLLVSL